MTLLEDVEAHFAEVHAMTQIGQLTAKSRDDLLLAPVNADRLQDTLKHLLNMVDALEETVKMLARNIDGRCGR